uniref:Integrase core domain containing protein n=1 Tax=Solanum tuberosum TaxID=4113 RepID=M1DMW6_SOLTU
MATLLQPMRSWMPRSVEECEAHMERMMDAMVQEVHKRLDTFELRVLERPGSTVDITTFQMELYRLRSDVDAFLALAETILEAAPKVADDEVVMMALFSDTMPPPDPSCMAGKHHHSSNHTSDTKEQRAQEIDVGPSDSRNTIDGVPTIDEGTTDGVPMTDLAGSEKSNPPAS